MQGVVGGREAEGRGVGKGKGVLAVVVVVVVVGWGWGWGVVQSQNICGMTRSFSAVTTKLSVTNRPKVSAAPLLSHL